MKARRDSDLPAPDFNSGSTDANHAIGLGIPATCVGVTNGGEAHHAARVDRYPRPSATASPTSDARSSNAARLGRR